MALKNFQLTMQEEARMTVRNSDPATSHASAAVVGALAARLRARVLAIAGEAREIGITINETSAAIPEHRAHSVSPRFAELVERGHLVRVLVGHGKSTKRFPCGIPRYATRWDEQTKRNVIVHWLPEFAPSKKAVVPAQAELPLSETA
jgi:hypothetical protein